MNTLDRNAQSMPARKATMSLSHNAGPARTRTAHEYVFRTLREAILDGRLPGGTRLIQNDLGTQLDVSVTPVREALRDLASDGLILFDPHRGALVRTLDLAEVEELYELRMTLEPLMVKRSVERISVEQLARAENLQRQMVTADSLTTWVELNREFHGSFVDPADNSRLSSILCGLRDSASAFVRLSLAASTERIDQSNTEHLQLVELYRKRDVEGVINLTLQHLQTTLATIKEAHDHGAFSEVGGSGSPVRSGLVG